MARAPCPRVPITKRALFQRINRSLARERQHLLSARGERAYAHLGAHYVVDLERNTVVAHHVDLLELAQELKVLRPWERLAEGERS